MNPIIKAGHGEYVRELYDQGIETNIIKKLLLEEKLLNVPEIVIKRFLELPEEAQSIEIAPPRESITTANIDELIGKYGLSFDNPEMIITHIQKTHVLMYLKQQDIWFREYENFINGDISHLNCATRNLKTMATLLDQFTHISMMANSAMAIQILEREGYSINVQSLPQSQTATEIIPGEIEQAHIPRTME
jgi:hypothetical protein